MVAAEKTSFTRFARDDIEQSLPSRFAQQVARHPDRCAVGFGVDSLTYVELDRLSNRVANALLGSRAPGPGPVALLVAQGPALIAAILGVLKAGKVYLPLDPSHPPSYLDAILEEAGVHVCVTDGAAATRRCDAVAFRQLAAHPVDTSPEFHIPPDASAYIYYTSGSTGRPKGVYDSHRNVLHNVMRYTNALRVTPDDRLTLLQSPGFSGAVSSLFSALLNGAAVFPYDLRKQGMGRPLRDWLQQEKITIYHSVPAVFRSFLSGATRFPHIRMVRLEGDAASRRDVELFRQHFPLGSVLANGLGATETGIVCQSFLTADSPSEDGIVPIGYATEDMQCLVLDDAGGEVPRGVAGELAIRSRFLATGYWQQPKLTRAAFVPTGRASDERVYRTGDLVRMRPDACLEYLGRKNARPKVNGHRVEPVEVEHALLGLSGVREAVVVIRENQDGSGELTAYVAPAAGLPSATALRTMLAARVPEHMLPARFVLLESLPLNDNGKLDRHALLAPERFSRGAAELVPPGDALEAHLVKMWERILDCRPIGVTDDFFVLGGNSMRGTEVLTALEELGEHDLPPSSLVGAPTIRQLAGVLRKDGVIRATALVPIQPRGSLPPIFIVHGHTGRVGTFGNLPRALSPDQPLYGLQSVGWWADRPLHTTIEAMAERYLADIRGVQPAGPYLLGGDCYGSLVALEIAHRLLERGERVALLFFMFSSPEDFPGLVPGLVRRRFQLHAGVGRLLAGPTAEPIRRHWRALSDLQARSWPGYVVKLLARMALRPLRSLGTPAPAQSRPRARHHDISRANLLAQKRYRPRSWPGRVTLILRAEDARRYSRDASREWGRVASGGYDVHFVPWKKGLAFRAPHVQVLADCLTSAIRNANA